MVYDIQAIEKSIMGADENTLKQIAESLPYDIYSRLSPEAKQRLTEARGSTVPQATAPLGNLPLKNMSITTLVRQLREAAISRNRATMMLPIEIVSTIEGRKQEAKWENIEVGKVLRYIADMMEQ